MTSTTWIVAKTNNKRQRLITYLGIIAIALTFVTASFSSHALAATDDKPNVAPDTGEGSQIKKIKPNNDSPPKLHCNGGTCVDRAPKDDNNKDNQPPVVHHNDRPDKDCATNPLLGKCSADCNTDKSFCECPRGFVMNENDHCAVEKCPRGFEQRSDDETGTCFPTAATLRHHPDTRPITTTHIHITNKVSATTAEPLTGTVPNGWNATFFDPTTPYCWYVVNLPPCFDVRTMSVIH